MNHEPELYNRDNTSWDYTLAGGGNGEAGFWCGGWDEKSNSSTGYHGILTQWWKHYKKGNDILLVSETSVVKKEFQQQYPDLNFYTIVLFSEDHVGEVDFNVDICKLKEGKVNKKFDVIINQATLEHVYDPFTGMKNLSSLLKPDGIMVTHTHLPGFKYHQVPRDYIRFMKDWWYDLPKHLDNAIELKQLWMHRNEHVFSCYKKL